MDALKKSLRVIDADYVKAKVDVEGLEQELVKTHEKVEEWIEDKAKVDEQLKNAE